jgi:putative transposase
LRGRDDGLAKAKPLLDLVDKGQGLVEDDSLDGRADELRRHERTGRPLGAERCTRRLEKKLARVLRPQKPGPKPSRKRKQVWCFRNMQNEVCIQEQEHETCGLLHFA